MIQLEENTKGQHIRAFRIPRKTLTRGAATMLVSLFALFTLGRTVAPSSVSHGALLGMIPFAAVLAIIGIGQTLVVQQGGIDLSVPGAVSLACVIVTHQPNRQDSKLLGAVLFAYVLCLVFGIINGILIARFNLNAIVTTLGSNALMYFVIMMESGGTPRPTTDRLATIAGLTTFGIPNSVYFALIITIGVSIILKRSTSGRRFEAVGANPRASRAIGLRVVVYQTSAYIIAQLLYCTAGILLAGILLEPSAYQGDTLLLPSVAVVVLGGTSLLGGRGFPVATALAALFLTQLNQFVLALNVPYAGQTLVQAMTLAIGIALYTVKWGKLLHRIPATHESKD